MSESWRDSQPLSLRSALRNLYVQGNFEFWEQQKSHIIALGVVYFLFRPVPQER